MTAWLDYQNVQFVEAGQLRVAYHDTGPRGAKTAILLHGFPYDVQAYAEVSEALTTVGYRVVVPYLRGYGPTTFLNDDTVRSGEQAVLGQDLLALMDALSIDRAILGGYDWGGRAACVVSALWPERVQGLATVNGYNIQNIALANKPAAPADEHRYWYQYYFHSKRGRAGLYKNRRELCRLLWTLWSPNWSFSDSIYAQSASSFDNPDFVDVVIHSYRHRYGLVAGDPTAEQTECALAKQPAISVPTISLDGEGDGVIAGGTAHHAKKFTAAFEHQMIPSVGHNLPQEAPAEFAAAILALS